MSVADAGVQPDEFADAFAKFASPEAGAGADPAPAPDPDPAPAADPAGADGDSGDAGDPGAPAAGGDPAPDDTGADPQDSPAPGEPAAAPADGATDALIERLGKMLQEAPPPAAAPAAAESEVDIYNADEKAFLATYDNDWGDVARGEALKRRGEYRDLIGYVFGEMAKQLRPVFDTVDVLSTRTHLSDLRAQVDDYDVVREKVVGWVEEQPMYLQTAYKQVIQAGTAEEVAHLIDSYRKATGAPAAAITQPEKRSGELSDDAKKAALSLAPVTTKRSTIPQADDPDDFDAAFARFAKGDQGK